MQLRIQRSQREGGVISKSVVFCLFAQVHFTDEEQRNILRYKLQNEVIYNSESSKEYLARSDASRDGSFKGNLRSLALVAMAAMKLNISISSLQRGQRIECKNLDELQGAEAAIMTACENLTAHLEIAATFDGREVLYDFATGGPQMVARAPGLALPVVGSSPVSSLSVPDDEAAAQPALEPSPPAPPASVPAHGLVPQAPSGNAWERLPPEQQRSFAIAGLILLVLFLWAIVHAHR